MKNGKPDASCELANVYLRNLPLMQVVDKVPLSESRTYAGSTADNRMGIEGKVEAQENP